MIRINLAPRVCRLLAFLPGSSVGPPLFATEPIASYALVRYHEGSELESLMVGKTTYREVKVRSVTACAVLITHARGMASVRLRDLAPEMQEAFGYDLAADRASDVALQKAPAERQAVLAAAAKSVTAAKPSSNSGKVDHLLRYFGQAANVRSDVDLRPQFRALELHAKDQGPRPSCSVFAVVSALGFLSRGSHRPGGEAVGGISHLVHAAEHPAGGPGCGPADG